MHRYLANEPLNRLNICALVVLCDKLLQHISKAFLVYVHKEAAYVTFKHPSIGIVLHILRHAPYAVVRAFSDPAIIRIIYESRFKYRQQP